MPSILIMNIQLSRRSNPTAILLGSISQRLIISKTFILLTSGTPSKSTRTVNGSLSGYVGRGNHVTTAKSWKRRHPQTIRTNCFTSPYIDQPRMVLVTTEPHRRPRVSFSPATKCFPPIQAFEFWKVLQAATWQVQGKDILRTKLSGNWIFFVVPVTCCKSDRMSGR